MAERRMNWTPIKTLTHSWKFASLACKPLHHPQWASISNFLKYANLYMAPLKWNRAIAFLWMPATYSNLTHCIFKSWQQHPTRHQLYGHLPPITKTIQVRRTRHAGHCWRSRDELISDVLLWTATHGRVKAGWPARKYIQQLCEDTGCSPEDLPEAMNDREKWWERVRNIRVTSTTWWWWYIYVCITLV